MESFSLLGEINNQGYDYSVVVEELMPNLARLNVSMRHNNSNKKPQENNQGIDLTADECEALGKHLIAVSERLRSNS
jgi:hypothetical protein